MKDSEKIFFAYFKKREKDKVMLHSLLTILGGIALAFLFFVLLLVLPSDDNKTYDELESRSATVELLTYQEDTPLLVTSAGEAFRIYGSYDEDTLEAVLQKGVTVRFKYSSLPNETNDTGRIEEVTVNGKRIVEFVAWPLEDILVFIGFPLAPLLGGILNIIVLCTFGVSIPAFSITFDPKVKQQGIVPCRNEHPMLEFRTLLSQVCGKANRLGKLFWPACRKCFWYGGAIVCMIGVAGIALALFVLAVDFVLVHNDYDSLKAAEIVVDDIWYGRNGKNTYAYYIESTDYEEFSITNSVEYDTAELLAEVTPGKTIQIRYERRLFRNFIDELIVDGKTIIAYHEDNSKSEILKWFFISVIVALVGGVIEFLQSPVRERKRLAEAKARAEKSLQQGIPNTRGKHKRKTRRIDRLEARERQTLRARRKRELENQQKNQQNEE